MIQKLKNLTLISLLIIFLLFIFQPLSFYYHRQFINFIHSLNSNSLSLLSSSIGAFGSILGGIITGIVAYWIANYQIKKELASKNLERLNENLNYKNMILNEIRNNQKVLSALDNTSQSSQIASILKYSLSNSIFLAISSNLSHDNFFVKAQTYYIIINRLQKDPVVLEESNFPVLEKEIKNLSNIEKELTIILENKNHPTSQ